MKVFLKTVVKILRSRFFLGALAIAAQIGYLFLLFLQLYEAFLPISIVSEVFYVMLVVYLLNRRDLPEFKLLWLIFLSLSPIIGAFILLITSDTRTNRREYHRYTASLQAIAPYRQLNPAMDRLTAENRQASLQADYLYRFAGMPCYAGTKTAYYAVGEDFHQALLEDLRRAEKLILLQYFIVEEGVMWDSIHTVLREKAASGVEVYMMYDDFGCIATLPSRYYLQLRKEGIHCFPSNQFKPIVSNIHNNRDHRKIAVIDGVIGYTGGINLADEYINAVEKFGHWKDTAVRLEGPGVQNLTAMFIAHWNAQSKKPFVFHRPPEPVPETDGQGYVVPFGDGPSPIYPETIGKNVYLNMISGAQRYLYISTPYLICDHELLAALCLAARKGVDVRLLTPHIPDKKTVFLMTRSNYRMLLEAGVRIYEYTPGFVHAKSFVCDDQYAVCGTINLDYRSLVHHFECGVWMYRADCIGDMKQDFLSTLSVSQEVTARVAVLRGWQRLLAEVMKVFSPLL